VQGSAAKIPQEDFAHYSSRAAAIIDCATFDRIDAVPEDLKKPLEFSAAEIAEYLHGIGEQMGLGEIRTGDQWISFKKDSEAAVIKNILQKYLGAAGLLYRGV